MEVHKKQIWKATKNFFLWLQFWGLPGAYRKPWSIYKRTCSQHTWIIWALPINHVEVPSLLGVDTLATHLIRFLIIFCECP